METIQSYLSKCDNSFDGLLNDWDHDQPLYPYLVLITRDNNLLINCLWYLQENNGFFLKQDRIIPNGHADDSNISQLYLKSATRYYNIYEEDKYTGITYTFYSKDACHKIYNFFDEEGEGTHGIQPFLYKKMPRMLEDPNNPPDWMKDNMIDEDDVVGMVTIQVNPVFGGDKPPQAVFILLMKRRYEDQQPHIFDLYEVFDYQKVFLQSKYLKSYSTKILVWAFVHDLKKDSDTENLCVMNNENNTKIFEKFIHEHYDSFSEDKKNECVMVFPDTYEKYIPSENVYRRLLTDNIMSMASIIRRYGIGGCYAISAVENGGQIGKLMVTVLTKMFNNRKQMLSVSQNEMLPLIIVLTFSNTMYNNNLAVKVPLGFWLYYYLYRYRNCCQEIDLPLVNTLITFTLINNSSSFEKLLNACKMDKCVTKMRENSWSTIQDTYALYELVFLFSNKCTGYWDKLSFQEQQLFPKRINEELGLDGILQYLNSSILHTCRGMEDEREFYARRIYELIAYEMESGDFKMRNYL